MPTAPNLEADLSRVNFADVHALVWDALEALAAEDGEILTGTERTVAGRLAIHLDRELARRDNPMNYLVDLEYERAGPQVKRIYDMARGIARKVVPDILLHHRGLLDGAENLLVIEVKPARWIDRRKIQTDIAKLALLTGVDEVILSDAHGLGRVIDRGMGPTLAELRLGGEIAPYRFGAAIRFRPDSVSVHWIARQNPVEWREEARGIGIDQPRPHWD